MNLGEIQFFSDFLLFKFCLSAPNTFSDKHNYFKLMTSYAFLRYCGFANVLFSAGPTRFRDAATHC